MALTSQFLRITGGTKAKLSNVSVQYKKSIFSFLRDCNARFLSNSFVFDTLQVTFPREHVAHVELHRPDKKNALNLKMWSEIGIFFSGISELKNIRAVVLSGNGETFSAGLDLRDAQNIFHSDGQDIARRAWSLRKLILRLQQDLSSLEKCPKPIIAAVSGPCIGAGVDLVCCADMRYCSADAYFQIKEVDIGIAADVGTLQRLPKIIGNRSLVSELAFTGRKLLAQEAENAGLVSRIFQTKGSLIDWCLDLASEISQKSPIAVQGTKHNLIYSRDNPVPNSLDYIATWNMSMLQTNDVEKSLRLMKNEQNVEFEDV